MIEMALTRKYLKALGIEEEKIEQIIEAHGETVDALKKERDSYKADAEKLPGVQQELDAIKAKGDDGLQQKYDDLKTEYETYKTGIENEKSYAERERAYKELCKQASVRDAQIEAVARADRSIIESLKLEDGNVVDADSVIAEIQKNWDGFVDKQATVYHRADNPPANNGGSALTRDRIMQIKDAKERRAAIAKNLELFGKGES